MNIADTVNTSKHKRKDDPMTKTYAYQVVYTVTGGYVKNLYIDARSLAEVLAVIKVLRTRIEILDANIIVGAVKTVSTDRQAYLMGKVA